MCICDLCKQNPLLTEKNENLKSAPWGLILTPPPGSGWPEKRLCWSCTIKVVDQWINLVEVNFPEKKTD